jgi:hypothetical protein
MAQAVEHLPSKCEALNSKPWYCQKISMSPIRTLIIKLVCTVELSDNLKTVLWAYNVAQW